MEPEILLLLTISTIASIVKPNDKNESNFFSVPVNTLSHELYNRLAPSHHNLVIAPFSIFSVLSMASLGAGGSTASSFRSVLSLQSSIPDKKYLEFVEQLASHKAGALNGIFVRQEPEIRRTFLKQLFDNYLAMAYNYSFVNPDNAEYEHLTGNKNTISATVVAAGNSIYKSVMFLLCNNAFNGKWDSPFSYDYIKPNSFQLEDGTQVQIPMMVTVQNIRFKVDDKHFFSIYELPFKGKRFAFYIVHPNKPKTILNLGETTLCTGYMFSSCYSRKFQSSGNVGRQFHVLSEQLVKTQPRLLNEMFDFSGVKETFSSVTMPIIKIEPQIMSLTSTLQDMGLRDAFSPCKADFNNISKAKLHLTQVLHKGTINVDRSGVNVRDDNPSFSPKFPDHTFRTSQPFIFFLRDSHTNLIIYQGKFSR